MRTVLRPARPEDLEYCARLYFSEMERTIRELNLDRAAHVANFHERWKVTQVRIITLDGGDIGWLQTTTTDDALFLAQLFVEPASQRQGIGTDVMKHLIDDAAHAGRAVTLGVVKTNPALRLYRRLGFQVTHDDDRKFYMRREPGTATAISSPMIDVRKMRGEDARTFLQVHHAAVREIAAKDYPPTVIEHWAPLPITEEAIEDVRANPENEIRVVAEIDGEIVGMGAIVPAKNKLRACYVAPGAARKGVGSALVRELERIARNYGLAWLELDASVTSETFYTALGYKVRGRGDHILGSGRRMACIKMRKDFLPTSGSDTSDKKGKT